MSIVSALSLRDSTSTDIALLSSARRVTAADGLAGMPGPRQVVRPLPQRHGAIDETAYMDGRTITIEGICTGSQTGVWTQYDALVAAFYDAIGTGRLLKWTRAGSSLALQATVRFHDSMEAPLQVDNGLYQLPYSATFFAEDPRAYAQTETTVTGDVLSSAAGGLTFSAPFPWRFTPSSGGSASVTHAGTVPAPATLRIYGACSSPQVLLVSTGERIVLTGSVAAGDYIELDLQTRTVLLNGTTNRANLLDPASTDWFLIPKGSSTLRLVAATFDASARLDVLHRSGWL